MAKRAAPDAPRAARWEIVGAWLKIWTPPRDVQVPPVPWRWVATAVVAVVALGVVVMLTVAPAIDSAKQRGAAKETREVAAARRAQQAFLLHQQRATKVTLKAGSLKRQVEAEVDAGARARVRTRELPARRVLNTECKGPVRVSGSRLRYSCLAVEYASSAGTRLKIGQPFVAILSRDRRSLTWCKVNEVAGEGASMAQVRVPLPAGCRD
jgi:hypothetical protein